MGDGYIVRRQSHLPQLGPDGKKPVLHRFHQHGLGDAVMFTSVLRHLKHYFPNQQNHVLAAVGQGSAYWQLADQVYESEPKKNWFSQVIQHDFWEPQNVRDQLMTKTEVTIRQLGMEPIWELQRYQVTPNPGSLAWTWEYRKRVPGKDMVALHYQGNTAPGLKDLTHEQADLICTKIRKLGYYPMVLDWRHKSPLPDGKKVWRAEIPADAAHIKAFYGICRAVVAIPSGPGVVAWSGDTPNLAVWQRYHPLNFSDRCPSTTHLIPSDHWNYLRGGRELGEMRLAETYTMPDFAKPLPKYRYEIYTDLVTGVCEWLEKVLTIWTIDTRISDRPFPLNQPLAE